MKRTKNVVYISLRLNLDNRQHSKVYDILHNLDPNIFKSMNQFAIDAIEEKIGSYGMERIQAVEESEEESKPILRKDIPMIEKTIKDDILREVENRVFELMSRALMGERNQHTSGMQSPEKEDAVSEDALDDVLGDLASEWAGIGQMEG